MEDILASIRRILSEDEAPAGSEAASAGPVASQAPRPPGDDVLVLDQSMMVPDPLREAEPLPAVAVVTPPPAPEPEPASAPPAAEPEFEPPATLVAPEAAAAAASSVDSLVRTLAAERTMQVRSGGPTIEDLVREELRPLLKAWLDSNLPPIVERLVRAEIERVVGRVVP